LPQGRGGRLWERIWIGLLHLVPLRLYTVIIRGIAAIRVPRRLRRKVLGVLARWVGMDLREAELPLAEYRSFAELFVRRLRAGARPVAGDGLAVCPVDGCVVSCGRAEAGELVQAKGIHYRLDELLVDRALAQRVDGGSYVTIYLRPRDYHRIHCPAEAQVVATQHVRGRLFPVQPAVVRNVKGLFVRNERLVIWLDSDLGTIALVCVGAAAVGSIGTVFDAPRGRRRYDPPVSVGRGAEIAAFHLGSTVVVVFERGRVELEDLQPRQEVRVGQVLGHQTGQVDFGAASVFAP
jgi:phosphatidylserine decarboxylase